jgi:hypothetical protein
MPTLSSPNWRDLFLRIFTLTQAQNIPCIQTYADDWAKLADDFEAIGLTETARNCRARFEQYRILTPGEYVRLIDQPIAELIHVPAAQ